MDIPLITTAPALGPRLVERISPAEVTATAQAQTAAALVAQTRVDLSPLSRFLSAVALFQKRMLELQANPAAAVAGAQSEEEIAALASSVAAVAESANTLQTSSLTGTSDDQSLALLFGQEFAALGASDDDSAELAAIGLSFASPSGLDDGAVLTVDSVLLEAAFAADPAATTALLTRTGAAFASLAGMVPGTSEEPPVLFDDIESLFAVPSETPAPALAAVPDNTARLEAPGTDDAFLQELLAETPRPGIGLAQAPPPSVTDATTTFEAQRVGPANPGNDEPVSTVTAAQSQSAAALEAERTPADDALAAQEATRDANARFADALAAERAANERIASALAEQRQGQGQPSALESDSTVSPTGTDEAAIERAAAQAAQQARLDAKVEQNRVERARAAGDIAPDEDFADPQRVRLPAQTIPAVTPQPLPMANAVPLPPPPLVQNPQQLARDPAIAAAIAAYNLSAGPFAALNGRPDLAAPRARLVPAVASVSKVAAIETDAATGESSRPTR